MENSHNKQLRVALIGLGAGAERIMLPGLTTLPAIHLVAASDLDSDRRKRVAERWQIPHIYESPVDMLRKEQPDLAVISTPPQTHFELSMLALENRCHLFCEKPFMLSLADAERVIAKGKECQCTVGVNSQYYQMPIYRQIQEMIDRGDVGRVYEIDAWQHMYLLPHDEGGWKAALQPRRVLLEFGTHAIDLICRFFKGIPHAVTARIARVRYDVDADVCISVRLDFDQDRFAHLLFNRMSYASTRYFELRLNGELAALRASLGGLALLELMWNAERKRPSIRTSLTKGGEARLEKNGVSKLLIRQPGSSYGDAAAKHLSSFVQAIQESREPVPSIAFAQDVLRVLFACYESAENGGTLVKL